MSEHLRGAERRATDQSAFAIEQRDFDGDVAAGDDARSGALRRARDRITKGDCLHASVGKCFRRGVGCHDAVAQRSGAAGHFGKSGQCSEIDAAARELALSLAQGPSVALGYIKRNINNAETMSLEACFDGEAIHHSRAGETADHKEAAKAFVEKRKPAFQGH